MTARFMTDPHAMRAMAGRFEVHAQTVEDEARRMWASSQVIYEQANAHGQKVQAAGSNMAQTDSAVGSSWA